MESQFLFSFYSLLPSYSLLSTLKIAQYHSPASNGFCWFLFSTHYVCLSGPYHTQYFQRLSSNSSGNKHFATRQLLKQGNIWPCTVNTRPFIRNGTKITFTRLPNTWHKQWKSSSDVQWGTGGAHPMGCQGRSHQQEQNSVPARAAAAGRSNPGLSLLVTRNDIGGKKSSLPISYSNKNVWKLHDNIRSQNQYSLAEFCAVLMKAKSCCPRTGSVTLCARA